MTNTPSNLLVVRDLLTAIRRKWFAGLVVSVLLFGLVIAYLVFAPRKYESEGKFYVQVGRGMVSADRLSPTENTVSVVETREAEVYSVIDILNSRGLAEQVVDEIGVERILKASSNDIVANEEAQVASNERDQLLRREKAIRKLQESLSVNTPRQAATISISCKIGSPELAQRIVQTVMDQYLTSHVNSRQTAGSFEFFDQQFRNEEAEVVEARESIRDFKNQIGIMDIALQKKALREQIRQIEEQMVNVSSELSSLDARVIELETQISETPAELAAEHVSGIANGGVDLMRQQLFAVEIEYQRLITKYHEHHPQVRLKREELNELRTIHAAQESARTETKNTVNPKRQQLEVDLLKAEADIVAQKARLEALQHEHAEEMTRLSQLNEHEVELASLKKELELAELDLKTYAAKREESRINLALDSERISNVKIIQSATLVLKPVSPKKATTILMGFALAVIGGLGACVVSHHVDPYQPRFGQRVADLTPYLNNPRRRRDPIQAAR